MDIIKESWAVKYRPTKLDNFYGQKKAISIIKGMQKRKEFPQAFLLTGSTSSGKTSLARVIASVVNGIEGTSVENNPDCLELNIGVNNKVEDARMLVSKIDFIPKRKFRVFILDEAHCFTKQAASALLKHIEEPPKHIIFILCSDTPEKILPTIKGRCVEIHLEHLSKKDIIKLLEYIVKKEKVKKYINSKLIGKIAEYGIGQPRNSIQILQLVVNLTAGGYDSKKALKEATLDIGSFRIEEASIKFLLGAYGSNPKIMIKALHDVDDHVSFLNVILELHSYMFSRNTNKTYHSPARKEMFNILKNKLDEELFNIKRSLQVHDLLVECKRQSGLFTVKDYHLLLGLINKFIK